MRAANGLRVYMRVREQASFECELHKKSSRSMDRKSERVRANEAYALFFGLYFCNTSSVYRLCLVVYVRFIHAFFVV